MCQRTASGPFLGPRLENKSVRVHKCAVRAAAYGSGGGGGKSSAALAPIQRMHQPTAKEVYAPHTAEEVRKEVQRGEHLGHVGDGRVHPAWVVLGPRRRLALELVAVAVCVCAAAVVVGNGSWAQRSR